MKKVLVFLFITFIITSCQEGEQEPMISVNSVEFSITNNLIGNGRTAMEDPSAVVISIENATGSSILDNEKISVSKFGNALLVDPVVLDIGEYKLVKFLVLNEADEVIYATPVSGSSLSSFVSNPLPIDFEITRDEASTVDIEVIETSSTNPEDLGYRSFSFSIIPTVDILISLSKFNRTSGNLELTEGDLSVVVDDKIIYSRSLGDSINVVKLRTDFDELDLIFSGKGLIDNTVKLSTQDLDMYQTTPLEVTLLSYTGLVAHFPFNGNPDDKSITNINGLIIGNTSLTTDQFRIADMAYLFDGNGDYIDCDSDNRNIINEVTLSAWVRTSSLKQQHIVSKTDFNVDAGYSLSMSDGKVRFSGRDGNGLFITTEFSHEINDDNWHHIAGICSTNIWQVWVDGEVIDTFDSGNDNVDLRTGVPLTIGYFFVGDNGDHRDFNGAIDNVQIYNKALSTNEVLALFKENQ